MDEILELFRRHGDSLYGGEAVTQLEHALQAAWAAERERTSPALVAAALLHDIGHLLHDLPEDAPDAGIDDLHETLGQRWLARHFSPAITEPVRMHVVAKRYLCAVEPNYLARLSPTSVQSLELQGGAFNPEEVQEFGAHAFSDDAVKLRRWDDAAKVVGLATPDLQHFVPILEEALIAGRP